MDRFLKCFQPFREVRKDELRHRDVNVRQMRSRIEESATSETLFQFIVVSSQLLQLHVCRKAIAQAVPNNSDKDPISGLNVYGLSEPVKSLISLAVELGRGDQCNEQPLLAESRPQREAQIQDLFGQLCPSSAICTRGYLWYTSELPKRR